MKKLIAMFFAAFAALGIAQAEGSGPPPDINQIRSRGYLIVGMTKFDSPPFYSGSGDNLRGLDVDIARRIGDYLRLPIRFRRDANSFQDVVDQVVRDEVDIAISKLSITGPRMQMVRFSTPYVKLRQAMVVNRLWLSQNGVVRDPIEIIRSFNGTIAFMRNSSYDTFARINFPQAQYAPMDNWNDVVTGVMAGRFSAGFRDEFEIKRIAWERPEASINTKTVTITDLVDSIAAAVDYRDTTLLAMVDHVINTEFNHIDVRRLINMYRTQQLNGGNR